MTRVYYKQANAACVVFDITNRTSFEARRSAPAPAHIIALQNAVKWKADLDSKVRLGDGRAVPCLLLANKVVHRPAALHLTHCSAIWSPSAWSARRSLTRWCRAAVSASTCHGLADA